MTDLSLGETARRRTMVLTDFGLLVVLGVLGGAFVVVVVGTMLRPAGGQH
jgi:hypothetical protein